ncbi:MAG: response regulator [Lachnospiraceae bacterium]|nr:response regulator [Lachnospiraceae bacterium]
MHTILIVSDRSDEVDALRAELINRYSIVVKDRGQSAMDYLKKAEKLPSLMILDLDLMSMKGTDLLTWIKEFTRTKELPVMVLSDRNNPSFELQAYVLGAVDFQTRPFVAATLVRKIDIHLKMIEKNDSLMQANSLLAGNSSYLQNAVTMSMQNVISMQQFIVGIMTSLITRKDGFTGIHSMRVGRLMQILMQEMLNLKILYLEPEDQNIIILGSQLFDMGKIGVPDEVLSKVGKYTDEEFTVMKNHTLYAAEAIQNFSYLLPNNNFVMYTYHMCRSHHERWDGKGYPDALSGENIPILARMVGLCDVYDALVSERPYKKPLSHGHACDIIQEGRGTQFDPTVVDVFMRVHTRFQSAFSQH